MSRGSEMLQDLSADHWDPHVLVAVGWWRNTPFIKTFVEKFYNGTYRPLRNSLRQRNGFLQAQAETPNATRVKENLLLLPLFCLISI
jgi:hypothetical protein